MTGSYFLKVGGSEWGGSRSHWALTQGKILLIILSKMRNHWRIFHRIYFVLQNSPGQCVKKKKKKRL